MCIYGIKYLLYIYITCTERANKQSSEDDIYHYLTEAAKFAASYRMNLGDPDFHRDADVVSCNFKFVTLQELQQMLYI